MKVKIVIVSKKLRKHYRLVDIMNTQEVVEIVKETHMWESLSQKEKREAIIYNLQMYHISIDEEEIQSIVDEDLSESAELQDTEELVF